MKSFLAVPYHEKHQAKSSGAKWDPYERRWFAPYGEIHLTSRWPVNHEPIHMLTPFSTLNYG